MEFELEELNDELEELNIEYGYNVTIQFYDTNYKKNK